MSFPPNKSDGPKEGHMKEHHGKIKDDYSHKFQNPKTHTGQPSCRSEMKHHKSKKGY